MRIVSKHFLQKYLTLQQQKQQACISIAQFKTKQGWSKLQLFRESAHSL